MMEPTLVNIKKELNGDFSTSESTKASVIRILDQIRRFQERIRKHIEDNYVEFMPNHTTSDMYIDEGETLLRETEHLLKNVGSDARLALTEANAELTHCVDELREVALGLRVSYRILKIDDLFQYVEEANATKDYLMVLDLLGKLKCLICSESASDVDRLFQKSDCYDTIKVKYHIQANILQQNLQQRFDRLVMFSEKSFPSAKNVTLQVSKDVSQLQDTVMALFQARYNPMKICDFLLDNCFVPMVTKPVSVEYSTDNAEYYQLNISYSLKELGRSLRPSYKQVFMHIKSLLDCLSNINVNLSGNQHVFTIIGSHIKERLLKLIVNECLIHAVPETMDDYQESTLVDDVLRFEQTLADSFFIDPETDCALSEFTQKFDTYFRQRFNRKVLESAREIMQKDLQDMATIAEGNSAEEVAKNPFLFPQCMISKSTLELVKLMERILRQPMDTSASIESEEANSFLAVIPIILNTYVDIVPEIHEKLLESIPQQAVLFYNNCMFLAHWVAKNAETDIPTHPALVKTLQSTGASIFKAQVLHQQKILMQILKEFDLSDTHSIGSAPLKLLRQCLRQMDLLKNVWLNVLPDAIYNTTFCNLLNDFCQDIMKRILSLEDISATVASELSELIEVILDKSPGLFKDRHEILRVSCWMKLQQLKMILNASLQEITEQWCDGAGILTANYKAEEIRHLIRALFQNTDRRAKALSRIV
ncbi:centromere/kinetochore protein zw10 [Lucilia sericata]|uniref:centromere/kinetochore protein zw10 n=1 Tax=Lucilia sericata TaxID=13632 RepID=UPI0018A80DD3|nr:centromere/kinetochore protein zw10 [Lucilia sericata]